MKITKLNMFLLICLGYLLLCYIGAKSKYKQATKELNDCKYSHFCDSIHTENEKEIAEFRESRKNVDHEGIRKELDRLTKCK